MKGAEAIVQTLSHLNVTTDFGYPGGAIMPVYDALLDSSVKHVLCRHEQGAAFAAVGYARSGKTTGVCIATSGPGASNLITALADAMMDSVSVVAITGQVPLDNQKLGMVKQWQELFFDGRYSETDLSDNPEFVSVAKAFGISGKKIERRDQVMPTLQEMLASKDAWLLHVCIDERENVWPLVPPGAANHDMMEEHP